MDFILGKKSIQIILSKLLFIESSGSSGNDATNLLFSETDLEIRLLLIIIQLIIFLFQQLMMY